MKLLGVLPLLLLALLAAAAPAHAGSYNVQACGSTKTNESWTVTPGVRGVTAKATCSGGNDDPMFIRATGAVAMNPDEAASLDFSVPAGLAIVDWKIDRVWTLTSDTAPSGFNKPYVLYTFNGIPFAGGGHNRPRADALGTAWANPPEGRFTFNDPQAKPVEKQTYPVSQTFGGGSTFSARLGCVGDSPCKMGPGNDITNGIRSAVMTIQDTTPPALTVDTTAGLLAPGPHNGNDPVTISASDPSGIKLVEVIDRSDTTPTGEAPAEVVNNVDTGACASTRVHQCPDVASAPFPAQLSNVGTYPIYVRATDAADNQAVLGPYNVTVTEAAEPTDKGAVNGDNATSGSTLVAGFGKQVKPAASVRFGKRAPVGGRLVNNAGVGISNAKLIISTKDKFAQGAGFEQRGTVTTGPDGSFVVPLRTPLSRTVRIAWRRYAYDTRAAARVELKLNVRALATLAKPRGVRRGRAFRLRGQVQGANPRKGVRLRVQVKRGKRWRTIGRGRAGKAGKYALRARVGQRGTARLRVQVRGRSDWPYAPGSTRVVRVRVS